MNELILKLIEAVEEGFGNYFCKYNFENGIEWDDNGNVVTYEVEALRQETKDIMNQLEIDCKNNLTSKEYRAAVDCILVLERLNNLLNGLEQE